MLTQHQHQTLHSYTKTLQYWCSSNNLIHLPRLTAMPTTNRGLRLHTRVPYQGLLIKSTLLQMLGTQHQGTCPQNLLSTMTRWVIPLIALLFYPSSPRLLNLERHRKGWTKPPPQPTTRGSKPLSPGQRHGRKHLLTLSLFKLLKQAS